MDLPSVLFPKGVDCRTTPGRVKAHLFTGLHPASSQLADSALPHHEVTGLIGIPLSIG